MRFRNPGCAMLCSGPACGSPAGAVANSSRKRGSAVPGLVPADDAAEPTRSTSSESVRWNAFCLRVADAVGVALAESVREAVHELLRGLDAGRVSAADFRARLHALGVPAAPLLVAAGPKSPWTW